MATADVAASAGADPLGSTGGRDEVGRGRHLALAQPLQGLFMPALRLRDGCSCIASARGQGVLTRRHRQAAGQADQAGGNLEQAREKVREVFE